MSSGTGSSETTESAAEDLTADTHVHYDNGYETVFGQIATLFEEIAADIRALRIRANDQNKGIFIRNSLNFPDQEGLGSLRSAQEAAGLRAAGMFDAVNAELANPTGSVSGGTGNWNSGRLGSIAAPGGSGGYVGSSNRNPHQRSVSSLQEDSVTGGKLGALLDFISEHESNGYYDKMLGGERVPEILNKTLREMTRDGGFMDQWIDREGGSASGRYQFIKSTLIDMINRTGTDIDSTFFNRQTQDVLITERIALTCPLTQWLEGTTTSDTFLGELCKVFASLPNPPSDNSFYAGVGNNAALVTYEETIQRLDEIQNSNVPNSDPNDEYVISAGAG